MEHATALSLVPPAPAATPAYRYRVFVSYSNADRKWGDWLFKRLDRYQVEEALVGQETDRGRVPNRLRPIFRDREGLSAGGDLVVKIKEALAHQHLVPRQQQYVAARQQVTTRTERTGAGRLSQTRWGVFPLSNGIRWSTPMARTRCRANGFWPS